MEEPGGGCSLYLFGHLVTYHDGQSRNEFPFLKLNGTVSGCNCLSSCMIDALFSHGVEVHICKLVNTHHLTSNRTQFHCLGFPAFGNLGKWHPSPCKLSIGPWANFPPIYGEFLMYCQLDNRSKLEILMGSLENVEQNHCFSFLELVNWMELSLPVIACHLAWLIPWSHTNNVLSSWKQGQHCKIEIKHGNTDVLLFLRKSELILWLFPIIELMNWNTFRWMKKPQRLTLLQESGSTHKCQVYGTHFQGTNWICKNWCGIFLQSLNYQVNLLRLWHQLQLKKERSIWRSSFHPNG